MMVYEGSRGECWRRWVGVEMFAFVFESVCGRYLGVVLVLF